MLSAHVILALLAVAALAWRPRSGLAALGVAAAGAIDVALGTPIAPALEMVAPLLTFLTAALTLAAVVERSGLAARAAQALASAAHGSAFALYALVCALCALLTAVVSLDGAVVLMVPILITLAHRSRTIFAPLFLGVVAVA